MADQKSIDVLFEQFAKMKVEIQALQQDNKILKEENKDLKLKVVKIQQDIVYIYNNCPTDPHEVYRQMNS